MRAEIDAPDSLILHVLEDVVVFGAQPVAKSEQRPLCAAARVFELRERIAEVARRGGALQRGGTFRNEQRISASRQMSGDLVVQGALRIAVAELLRPATGEQVERTVQINEVRALKAFVNALPETVVSFGIIALA